MIVANDRTELCDIMLFVPWQVWIDIREEAAVAKQLCIYIGLRKQNLGYHNSWDCWYFILLLGFRVLHCVDVGSAY